MKEPDQQSPALGASIQCMPSTRATFTLDDDLAAQARLLEVNISASAREGVERAVRAERAKADRAAYLEHPEKVDEFWGDAEAWGEP